MASIRSRASLLVPSSRVLGSFAAAPRASLHPLSRLADHARPVAAVAGFSKIRAFCNKPDGKNDFTRATELCMFATQGDLNSVRKLLEEGVDINSHDYDKRTPLHLAAAEGHLDLVKFLVEKGANVNSLDRWGGTAMTDSIRSRHPDVTNFLRSHGAKTYSLQDTYREAGDQRPKLKPNLEGKLCSQEHMDKTFMTLVDEGLFNYSTIRQEVDWYYNNLGLQPYYFFRYSPEDVASHIQSYISAKKIAQSTGRSQDIHLNIQTKTGAFFLCPSDHDSIVNVEKHVDNHINKLINDSPKAAWSVTSFLSTGVAVPYGSKKLALHIVEQEQYIDSDPAATETDLYKVATGNFFETTSQLIQDRYQEILKEVVNRNAPLIKIFPTYHDGTIPMMIAHRVNSVKINMYAVSQLLQSNDMTCERKMARSFSNGVNVYSLYVHPKSANQIREFANQLALLFTVPLSPLTPANLTGQISAKHYAYTTAAMKFIYYYMRHDTEEFNALAKNLQADPVNLSRLQSLRKHMRRQVISEERIAETILRYPEIIEKLFDDFQSFHLRDSAKKPMYNEELATLIDKHAKNDLDQAILLEFVNFNSSVLKTNFFRNPKAALSFRVDPSKIMGLPGDTVPFGIFLVMANDFQGFHVRFQDVARGGIRLIISANDDVFKQNQMNVFAENYNLAFTQNLKNKDIPEFGSKGTILMLHGKHNNPQFAFRKYISGLMDLLMPTEEVVDHYGKPEFLFLGPDENTADVMEWAALYAKRRGYPFWKAFTTGKPTSLGGIPHDTYGMTSRGVHKYVVETLNKLNLDESKIFKLQTGGPDGDLGSNEILLSCDRTKAIVDGAGVLYDPEGIDRDELTRLAHSRQTIKHFNERKLGKGGFKVLVEDRDKKLPTGETVASGLTFRNEFHLHPLSSADLFVPCGGRPEAVNVKNVHRLFNADGTPRFKVIVEGANLFFTNEARMIMEKAGVVLFKDASANKGGVTSSSLEVLAGLTLTEDEFEKHMMVKDKANTPQFYQDYVIAVQQKIEENAGLEFNCIWNENQRTGTPRHLLTDQISDKINTFTNAIATSTLWDNEELRNRVLSDAIPKMLQDLVGGVEVVQQRVPQAYVRAIFNKYLASRYVYKYGLRANEFAFFEYMQDYLKQ